MNDKEKSNYAIEVENLEAGYGSNKVLRGLNLCIKSGEIVSVVGPSGEGKTTLIECISGTIFEKRVKLTGQIKLNSKISTYLETQKRNVGVVFQDLALFPNMNVEGNLKFPLEIRGINKNKINSKVESMLDLLKLRYQRKAYMHELSGGEKQRVALGRALIYEPGMLLMDESLKSLDPSLKTSFINDLLMIHNSLKFTLVFVTHDQDEALLLSDRIAVLHNGLIVQIDTPEKMYHHPANIFVANFFGESNWKKTKINKDDLIWGRIWKENDLEKFFLQKKGELNVNEDIDIWIRPENIIISDNINIFDNGSLLVLEGKILQSYFMGDYYKINVKTISGDIFLIKHSAPFHNGDTVYIGLKIKTIKIFQEVK